MVKGRATPHSYERQDNMNNRRDGVPNGAWAEGAHDPVVMCKGFSKLPAIRAVWRNHLLPIVYRKLAR